MSSFWAFAATTAIGSAIAFRIAMEPAKRSKALVNDPNHKDRHLSRTYHNERIYYLLELFMKLMLAIVGALGFLLVNAADGKFPLDLSVMITPARFMVLSSGLLFACLVAGHHYRKVKRDPDRAKYQPLLSGECWMFVVMVTITLAVGWVFVPALLSRVPREVGTSAKSVAPAADSSLKGAANRPNL